MGEFVLGGVPAVVLVVWLVHLRLSVRGSRKATMTRWVLFAGLPVAAFALFLWSVSIPTTYSGVASLSGPGTMVMVTSAVVVMLWFVMGFAEIIMELVRGTRRSREQKVGVD